MSIVIDNEFIINSLTESFNKRLQFIITDIASNHSGLDCQKLINKYCNNQIVVSKNTKVTKQHKRKRKKNTILKKNELCMARKADGFQCTRRRKEGLEFCGKHNKNLKFGRVDEDEKFTDTNKYIKTTKHKINGNDYLIDDNDLVYSIDIDQPNILGKRIDGDLFLIEKDNDGNNCLVKENDKSISLQI